YFLHLSHYPGTRPRPVTRPWLPKQAHARIPGRDVDQTPAPIRHSRQKRPRRPAAGTGEAKEGAGALALAEIEQLLAQRDVVARERAAFRTSCFCSPLGEGSRTLRAICPAFPSGGSSYPSKLSFTAPALPRLRVNPFSADHSRERPGSRKSLCMG